jgi:hypothetical protein
MLSEIVVFKKTFLSLSYINRNNYRKNRKHLFIK